MDLHHPMAGFALDRAAPVEFAAAPFHNLHFVRVKAAAAAHQLAAVDGLGGLVALPPTGAQHPVLEVMVTEVRTGVQVDEVLVCVWLELGVFGHQHFGGSDLALFDLCGTVEFLLEDVAHFAEGGHGLPAGLELARARHSMALALHPHVVQDSLQEQTRGTGQDGQCGVDVTGRVKGMGSGRALQKTLLGQYGVKRSPDGSSRGCRAQLGCYRAVPTAWVCSLPLPSSPPRCCGGSLTLCWKRPLCSSPGCR